MAFVTSHHNCPLVRSLNLLQKARADRSRNKSSLFEQERTNKECILVKKYTPIHCRKSSQNCSLERVKAKKSPRETRVMLIRKPQSKIAFHKSSEKDYSGTYFRTFALKSSREKIINKKPMNISNFRKPSKKVLRVNITMQANLQSQDSLEEKLSPWI